MPACRQTGEILKKGDIMTRPDQEPKREQSSQKPWVVEGGRLRIVYASKGERVLPPNIVKSETPVYSSVSEEIIWQE